MNTNPIITAASFSSETDIPRMTMSANVITGHVYLFTGQLTYSVSNVDVECDIRIRKTTAVTGAIVGRARLGRLPNTGYGQQICWSVPWVSDATGVTNFYFSIRRGAGTGNTTLEGGDAAFSSIFHIDSTGTLRIT
jgi:hypothetical protein